MRAAAAGLLLLGACSRSADVPAPPETPVSTRAPATGTVSKTAAVGSELRGETSGLHGDVTGLITRVTRFGTVVELPADTLFAFDKAELSAAATANLNQAAALIRAAPPGPVGITGHTDSKGDGTGVGRRASGLQLLTGGTLSIVDGAGHTEAFGGGALPQGFNLTQEFTQITSSALVLVQW